MVKNNQAITGEEYKILKANNRIKKIATVIALVWSIVVIAPISYVVFLHGRSLKNFVVVYSMDKMNSALTQQYETLINTTLQKINLDKKIDSVVSKIKIPEIKIDKITDKTSKVTKTTKKLGKISGIAGQFGVKSAGIDKQISNISDINAKIEKSVKSANAEIVKSKNKLTQQLKKDIEPMIKAEIRKIADKEMQKVLKLNNKNYANFISGRYGILTPLKRSYTNAIYTDFLKNKTQGLKFILPLVEKYFSYIRLAFVAIAIVIALIPILLMFGYVKKITSVFSKCPYCGKIYFSKANAFNLIKLLQFWK